MPLTEEERSRFALHFLLLDTDLDGKLPLTQLGALLRSVGLYPAEHELETLKTMIDPQETGMITQADALATIELLLPQKTTPEALREAFKVLDEDADGYVTTAQLRHILVNLGTPLAPEEVDEVLADLNKDDDRMINIDDLIAMLLTETPLRA